MVDNRKDEDVFELSSNDRVLSLEWYLHREIEKWQDGLEIALIQGKDLDAGLINRGIAGDSVADIADSMGLIDLDEDSEDSKDFKEKFEKYREQVEAMNISKNHKTVKLSDFKVKYVLKKINLRSTKRGTIIV